ncbi:MAG: protein translocase subunit SecF, partial [Firmicutes bacterium]|nr:protein translocase subunit SecF [Bacillota bacterium]
LSVITSLLVSRLYVYVLYGMGFRKQTNYAHVSAKKKKIFDFVGKKIVWFIIAAVIILAGIGTMIVNGASSKRALNYSIEFVGGYSTTVDFDHDISIEEFNNEIKPAIADIIGSTDIEGQKTTGSNQFVIKTPEIDLETWNEIKDMLVSEHGADAENVVYEHIGSSISGEMVRKAFISLAIATVLMLIYIWIRFRKFKFAISSVIALLHDVLILLTGYAIFRLTAGNSFIACVLTIVGYSINATIVIFDRIRENQKDPRINYDLKKVVNTSIQQTLSRSILTSATTFVMVLLLIFMGVESMQAFAIPLAIGIVAGAYSSVFISGCLYYVLNKKSDRYDESRAKKFEKYGDAVTEAVPLEAAEEIVEETETVKITANPNRKKKKKRKQ